MSLVSRIRANGLSNDQIRTIFNTEMQAYRNQLEHIVASWTLEPELEPLHRTERNLVMF